MKTCRTLEWLVACMDRDSPLPWYYLKGEHWQRNPRKAAVLTSLAANRLLQHLKRRKHHGGLAIVSIHEAVRLFRLQQRRGDIRSLVGPDDPGVPMLTAQSKH